MFRNVLLIVFVFICFKVNAQQNIAVFVDAGDNQALITAIENGNSGTGPGLIFIRPGQKGETTYTFTESYMNSDSALPPITGDIEIFPVSSLGTRIEFKRAIDADQFRFVDVNTTGVFGMGVFNIEGFSSNSNGGAIRAYGEAQLRLRGTNFRNNFASGEGGAIFMGEDSHLTMQGHGRSSSLGPGEFNQNRAGSLGGAISVQNNATALIKHQVFVDNIAGVFGCDININSSSNANFGHTLVLESNTFAANCPNVLIENPNGRMYIRNNTFSGMGNGIDSTDLVTMFGNLFALESSDNRSSGNNAICNDFGTNAFKSLGYNLSNEDSCNLDQETDITNTDPNVNTTDPNNVISLNSNSPAIDAGPVDFLENTEGFDTLPCSFKDARGLGRPQDANNDGIYECDIGSYEVQSGADLTNAQSALYFDPDRNGEGVIIEMLSADSALVTMFTYHPNETDLMWFISVGNVVGNTLVFDEVLRTSGGVFGAGFNAESVTNSNVGGMSLIFPDCDSPNPGRLVFEAEFEFAHELENLLVKNSKLSSLINCDQSQPNPQTGRSGSFYEPTRSGEGVFIQVLNDGSAVVIFYTYTPDGKQFWFISSDVEINGNTMTANMIYPASTTGFGSQFNPNELDFQPWGTVILEYLPGCNSMNMSYNSSVTGFGSGNHTYQLLTQPAGTTCDL